MTEAKPTMTTPNATAQSTHASTFGLPETVAPFWSETCNASIKVENGWIFFCFTRLEYIDEHDLWYAAADDINIDESIAEQGSIGRQYIKAVLEQVKTLPQPSVALAVAEPPRFSLFQTTKAEEVPMALLELREIRDNILDLKRRMIKENPKLEYELGNMTYAADYISNTIGKLF